MTCGKKASAKTYLRYTGYPGGQRTRTFRQMAAEVKHNLNVPHASVPRIQEIHIMIGHILCALVDEHMKGLQ